MLLLVLLCHHSAGIASPYSELLLQLLAAKCGVRSVQRPGHDCASDKRRARGQLRHSLRDHPEHVTRSRLSILTLRAVPVATGAAGRDQKQFQLLGTHCCFIHALIERLLDSKHCPGMLSLW